MCVCVWGGGGGGGGYLWECLKEMVYILVWKIPGLYSMTMYTEHIVLLYVHVHVRQLYSNHSTYLQ